MAVKPLWFLLATLLFLIAGIVALQSLKESPEDRAMPPAASPAAPGTGAAPAVPESHVTGAKTSPPLATPERVARVERPPARQVMIAGRVQDESGQPLEAATVDLRGEQRHRTRTDADGHFAIPVGADATGSLVVDHPGFAGSVIHHVQPGKELVVTLAQGIALRGVVRDHSGQGIPDALLFALTKTMPPRLTTSDAQGAFVLPDLEAGSMLVQVVHLGYQAGTEPVEMPRADIEIELQAGDAFQGVVVDEISSAPIAGATITCTMMESAIGNIWFATDPPNPTASQVTGGDGRFHFDRIGLSAAKVRVTADGYVPFELHGGDWQRADDRVVLKQPLAIHGAVASPAGEEVAGAEVSYDVSGAEGMTKKRVATEATGEFTFAEVDPYAKDLVLFARHDDWAPALVPVDLAAVRRNPLRIELGTGACIRGRVLQSDHTPAAQVEVHIEAALDDNSPAGKLAVACAFDRPRMATGKDGAFVMAGLPAGDYRLEARSSPMVACKVRLAGGETKEVTLEMAACAPIEGRCVDADGHAMSDVFIEADAEGDDPGGARAWTKVDPQGRFALTAFGTGTRVRITARHELYVDRKITVDAGTRDVVVPMVVSARLIGRVLDAATRRPVGAFTAELGRYDTEAKIEVHNDGTFLAEHLALQEYPVTVIADGYAPKTTSVTIAKADQEVVVLLEPAALWGTVRFQNRAPASMVDVDLLELQEADASVVLAAATQPNARGVFAFGALDQGRFTLAVGNPQHPFASEIVEIVTGRTLEKHFVLPDPITLTVTVQLANGKPLTRGRVTIDPENLGIYASAALPLSETGQVVFSQVLPGDYKLRIDSLGRESFEQAIEITQWLATEVTVIVP